MQDDNPTKWNYNCPFLGSGSTGIAAIQSGFDFIGIEKEEEYFKIAEKRIQWAISNLE